METKMMSVLEPDFYKDFHCAAAGCRANCCVYPWQITINKKNYKELRALKEPKWLAENFGTYFVLSQNRDDPRYYATVRPGPNGGCPMQTPEGLCRLQVDAGAQYLSQTCQSYPRQDSYLVTPSAIEVQRERGLTVSCEEVDRMLLEHPQPIRFITWEDAYSPGNFDNEGRHATNFILNDGKRPLLAHYNLVRMVCVALLQNRTYPIEQRLMTLLIYLDKVAKAEEAGTESELPQMSTGFVQAVEEGLYDALLTAAGGALSSTLLSNIAFAATFSNHEDSNITTRCNSSITTIPYQTRLESYRAFAANKAHFLEHLLVMEFFDKALPFKTKRSIFDCMQYMVSVFTIYRFMLGAYLGEAHAISDTELIDFTAFFGKVTLHTEASFDRNIALLKSSDMDTLPHLMSILLG